MQININTKIEGVHDAAGIAFNLPEDEFNTIPELRVAALAFSTPELEIIRRFAHLAGSMLPDVGSDDLPSSFSVQLHDAVTLELSRRAGN